MENVNQHMRRIIGSVCFSRCFTGSRIFPQTGIFCEFSLFIINLTDRQLLFIENETVTWAGERSSEAAIGGGRGSRSAPFWRDEVNEPKKTGAHRAAQTH